MELKFLIIEHRQTVTPWVWLVVSGTRSRWSKGLPCLLGCLFDENDGKVGIWHFYWN